VERLPASPPRAGTDEGSRSTRVLTQRDWGIS